MRLLNSEQEELLKDERRLLNNLQMILERLGITQDDQEALFHSIQQLDELFLIVVVGEFNSGKSAIINALLGQTLLQEGVTPTTTKIYILRYGENQQQTLISERQILLTAPIEFLHELSIVDTPGTNAVIREHEIITTRFIPRSDLIIFITSADRPFTESERNFLELIREWEKKVVFVVNKIDILNSDKERIEIENFVLKNVHSVLEDNIKIFSVSARDAIRAKQEKNQDLWEKSRFKSLEEYIRKTLDEKSRFRFKLLNPLGVGNHLAEKCLEMISSRLQFLQSDFNLIDEIENQLNLYKEDIQRYFNSRMAEVENLLYEMETRGQVFFDETFRLGRFLDLLSKARVHQEFERYVVADVPQSVEEKVEELINWLVDSDLKQWQTVVKLLSEKDSGSKGYAWKDIGIGNFYRNRQSLINTIVRETRRVVESYDKIREAKAIAESARTAVATTAAIEASALGLGAIVTTLATTAAADVTGFIMAGFIAVVGFFIIPAKRRQGKTKLMEKISAVRKQLIHSLQSQFNKEIDRSFQQIHEAIAPYTRFIRSERDKMTKYQSELQSLKGEMVQFKGKLEEI